MAKLILHMLSPLKHMSPFDVNMALDAGYDSVTPYTSVTLEEIEPLVQDAMFSRSPRDAVRTGVFIAGKDAIQALDMLEKAKKTLLKPFEISLFADPAGSFTTAAAMVACVEKVLKEKKKRSLSGTKVVVYGATGVVGFSSAVIAALEGAHVTLAGYNGPERVEKATQEIKKRFGVETFFADASDPEKVLNLLVNSEIALCAGRAGCANSLRRRCQEGDQSSRFAPTSTPSRRSASKVSVCMTMARNCPAAATASVRSRSAM